MYATIFQEDIACALHYGSTIISVPSDLQASLLDAGLLLHHGLYLY